VGSLGWLGSSSFGLAVVVWVGVVRSFRSLCGGRSGLGGAQPHNVVSFLWGFEVCFVLVLPFFCDF